MTSFRQSVTDQTRRVYRPLRNLASKNYWRQRYWNLLSSLPERDLSVETRHGRLSFSSRDKFIGHSLYTAGSYGYEDIFNAVDVLKSQGKLSDTNPGHLIDIGANVGTVCIPLLLEHVFKNALAFEPEPRNFRYLNQNIKQNNLAQSIQAFQMALSSESGELELELSNDNYGDHRIRVSGNSSSHYNQLGEQGRSLIKVPVQTLDDTIKSLAIESKDVQLLWMDVQGHEGHIFQGAESLIATGVPVVFEFWPYGLRSAGTSLEWFTDFVSTRFSHLWDLGAAQPDQRPASAIQTLCQKLSSDDATAQTDVLVF